MNQTDFSEEQLKEIKKDLKFIDIENMEKEILELHEQREAINRTVHVKNNEYVNTKNLSKEKKIKNSLKHKIKTH